MAIGKSAGAASIFDEEQSWLSGRCHRIMTVYRWAYTMTLSILHRVTGVGIGGRAARPGRLAGERQPRAPSATRRCCRC